MRVIRRRNEHLDAMFRSYISENRMRELFNLPNIFTDEIDEPGPIRQRQD